MPIISDAIRENNKEYWRVTPAFEHSDEYANITQVFIDDIRKYLCRKRRRRFILSVCTYLVDICQHVNGEKWPVELQLLSASFRELMKSGYNEKTSSLRTLALHNVNFANRTNIYHTVAYTVSAYCLDPVRPPLGVLERIGYNVCNTAEFRDTVQKIMWLSSRDKTNAAIKWQDGWFSSTVVGLAQAIKKTAAFDRLPILADALEEAGCVDKTLLAICRQTTWFPPYMYFLEILNGGAKWMKTQTKGNNNEVFH